MEDDLARSLIFPTGGRSEDFPQGKSKLLWTLTNFRVLREKLGDYRSNKISLNKLFGPMGARNSVGELIRYCPLENYACLTCPFQIEGPFCNVGSRKGCALFIIKDKPNEIALIDLLDYIDDVIARASRCAEENKWDG